MTAADQVQFAVGVLRTHGCTVDRQAGDGPPRWWVVTARGRTIRGITEPALLELAADCADRGLAAQPSLLDEGVPHGDV